MSLKGQIVLRASQRSLHFRICLQMLHTEAQYMLYRNKYNCLCLWFSLHGIINVFNNTGSFVIFCFFPPTRLWLCLIVQNVRSLPIQRVLGFFKKINLHQRSVCEISQWVGINKSLSVPSHGCQFQTGKFPEILGVEPGEGRGQEGRDFSRV